MEEFKIITIPTNEKEDDEEELVDEVDTEDDDYVPPRKRFVVIPLFILFVIIALFIIRVVTTYKDYETQNTWERNDAAESQYVDFKNNIIKYSSDGIFYTTYNGTLIWNYTYDMNKPMVDTCDNYVVAFDRKGTEIDIFSNNGFVNSIKTNIPVIDAQVGNQGTIAVLLQEGGISYIQMYDQNGTLLVSGEMHPENSGYPVSIALSSDATRLMVSMINLNDGNISTNILFYDFSDAGKKEVDNIVANYSYIGMLIPQIDFLKGDKAVAFGDSEIIIYNNNVKATVEKEIFVTDKIKSIFYNNKYVGYVSEVTKDDGEVTNNMTVYNLYGFRCMNKSFPDKYEKIYVMNNNEIVLEDGENISIYNMQGFRKFKYSFDESIYLIIPGSTSHRYYVIEETATKEIRLK